MVFILLFATNFDNCTIAIRDIHNNETKRQDSEGSENQDFFM
jgi:hypothetical protein